MTPTVFPIVSALMIVPIPSPLMPPKKLSVNTTVTITQIKSNEILICENFIPVISDSSFGKRSVGMIGILQRFDNATPMQRMQ